MSVKFTTSTAQVHIQEDDEAQQHLHPPRHGIAVSTPHSSTGHHHDWHVKELCTKYCRSIVPPRKRAVPLRAVASRAVSTRTAAVSGYSIAAAHDQIDGTYEEEMKFCPPPLTMLVFSVIEVAFFVTDIVYLKDYQNSSGNGIGTSVNGPAARLFIYNPWRREEAWRFVTYMFVHVGIMHIMMNLIVQLFLGTALELVHCWWRVALVYLSGVLAGSMGTSIANPGIYLAGASGGVYALITSHIATIILNWDEMEFAVIQLFVFLVFCSTDFGLSIYRHMTDPNDRVGYIAHLCGALAGILVGIGVLRNLKVHSWEKKLWWFAVTLYFALMIAGVCFHIFHTDYFLPSQIRHSPAKSGF